jgi:anthranilate/para-aminobenzoate synthase component II
MNVLIINGGSDYRKLFESLGHTIVANVEDAQLAVFTGGADVSPKLYGAEKHPFTGVDARRDIMEKTLYEALLARKVPMVGICRGAQFLNVMSGGAMYQHVESHTRAHYIIDQVTGETVYVSSTHHQMMKPFGIFHLIATSNNNGNREWFEGSVFKRDVADQDIEVVFYPNTKCLCFQPHPEFDGAEYEGMKAYFRSLLNRYLEV